MNEYEYKLINLAKAGDLQALEKLIKLEQNNIYATLFCLKKNETELHDIMQNVLIKFSSKLYQLKNPEFFKTWLNKIIVNAYYDYIRKNKKYFENKFIDNPKADIPDLNSNPSNEALYSELNLTIKKVIEQMPNQYRIPITLREFRGLSYETISKITNTSIGTVKSRIARAREIIKNQIKNYTGD